MKIPRKVCVGPEQWFPVKVERLKKGLGFFDPKEQAIYIEATLPEVGKFCILLHELIHIADIKNKDGGEYSRGLTEKQVTGLAGTLFLMMAHSGLLKGVSQGMLAEIGEVKS